MKNRNATLSEQFQTQIEKSSGSKSISWSTLHLIQALKLNKSVCVCGGGGLN
jgi:phosphoheptose isomerase